MSLCVSRQADFGYKRGKKEMDECGKFDLRLGRRDCAIHKMSVNEQKKLLRQIWREKMGYELDLEHPRTFNEKLQWYKLYYHHPDMTRCVDKVTFKDYVSEKLGDGYTAKLLRVWDSPDEVCFDGLPERFVVKSNCQDKSQYIAIIRDKQNYDFIALKEEIRDYWFNPMNLLINGFCGAYHDVKPKVFVEEYIEQSAESPDDCKLFCFNGKAEFCYITTERFRGGVLNEATFPMGFYTLNWEPIDVTYGNHPIYKNAPRPKYLPEMIELSRILSADFPFVRVDFFLTEQKLYLAELTFYPGGGMVRYDPPEFETYMGDMFLFDTENQAIIPSKF